MTKPLGFFFVNLFAVVAVTTAAAMGPRGPRALLGPVVPRIAMGSRSAFDTATKRAVVDSSSGGVGGGKAYKVVTDIDDTVKSSGGVRLLGIPLGGIDTQFKRGTFYPGAFQFAFEVSSAVKRSIPENVAVLTARAREFKFALALKQGDKLCSAFRAVGQRNGAEEWGIGDVYYGSVVEWIFQERKGTRKLENFEIMLRNDQSSNRNCQYILVGDTGEKDEDAGERIAKKYGASRVRAVFLHTVSDAADRSQLQVPKDRALNGVPIYYFRTYVGAANKAYRGNLLGRDALLRVVEAARADLDAVEAKERELAAKAGPLALARQSASNWSKSNGSGSTVATRRNELEEDIEAARWSVRRSAANPAGVLNIPRIDFFTKGTAALKTARSYNSPSPARRKW